MTILVAEISVVGTLLVIGAVLLTCVLLILADRLLLAPQALLMVEDVITTSRQPVALSAKVERDILPFGDPPLRGVEVNFYAVDPEGRRLIGAAKTDVSGVAKVTLPPFPAPGRFRYIATLAGALKGEDAGLIVDVVDADTPVFVIDIDYTVADVHPFFQIFRNNNSIGIIEGSPAAVRAITPRYAVVFLTARDRIFRQKTLDWLRSNGFPEAPVILRRRRVWSQKAADHKRERLAELAALKLAVGVGDLQSDAAVYRERGMRAYILGNGRADGAVTVRDWQTLVKDLLTAGLLPAASESAPPSSSSSRT